MDDGLRLSIKKLGHELEEIRVRALLNILSKLELQIVRSEELLDEPELFPLLVKWFEHSPAPKKTLVLELILRLVKEKEGLNLLLRNDPDLFKIRHGIGKDEKETFKKLCEAASLSRSSSESKKTYKKSSRANSISSRSESQISIHSKTSTITNNSNNDIRGESISRVDLSFHSSLASDRLSLPLWNQVYWPSPTLAKADKKVLVTVQNSLKDESQRNQALNFFSTVVLNDFPPQIFLNDNTILLALLEIIENNRENERALCCLEELTNAVLKFFLYYSDPFVASNFVVEEKDQIDYQAGGDSNLQGEYLEKIKKDSQVLGVGDFCALILDKIGPLLPSLFKILSLSISDPETFWSCSDQKSAPLKHSLVSILSSLAHNLLRAKGESAIKRLKSQINAAQILKSSIPKSVSGDVLPQEMQAALIESLTDPILYLLQPEVYSLFLSYVKYLKYQPKKPFSDFLDAAESLKAGATFIKSHKTLSVSDFLSFFENSLKTIEIHKDFKMIEYFFETVYLRDDFSPSQKEIVQDLTAKLLAMGDTAKLISYKTIADYLTEKIGPKASSSETSHYSSLYFVLNRKVLKEILYYGLRDENNDVRNYSERIILLTLKSRLLVSTSSWRWLISEISCLFSVLHSYADLNSSLGRTVLSMLDPDTSKEIMIPNIEVLKGNIQLMFSKIKDIKNEATARVIYLLKIPSHLDLNETFNLGDNPVSTLSSAYGGYEEACLMRVLEVLSKNSSDDGIIKHALTKLSLIMEDRCLHVPFLDYNGLEIVLNFLQLSLTNLDDNSVKMYTNCVVILKHLSRYNAQLRHDFSNNFQLYDSILKGIFVFNVDWKMLRDISQLLSFMVFSDIVITTSDAVSFPLVLTEKTKLPFDVKPHSEISDNVLTSKIDLLLDDKTTKSSFGLLWFVFVNGIESISESNVIKNTFLPVSQIAVDDLLSCYLPYNINKYLNFLSVTNSHEQASDNLNKLKSYMSFAQLCDSMEDLENMPWEKAFSRYFTLKPAHSTDQLFLVELLRFITFSSRMVPNLKKWLIKVVKDPCFTLNSILTRILMTENTPLEKEIAIEILSLMEICIKGDVPDGWENVTSTLMQCLSHSHTQKFYSIAILDKLLNCLLNIIELKIFLDPKVFWQILNAFHCETANSCMGLTITRTTLLCLSNLLALKPKSKKCWFPPEMKWLNGLIASKDLVVKAATLEFVSGLCLEFSSKIIEQIPKIWEICLNMVLDHNEASMVREQAANVCSNLISTTESKVYLQMSISSQFFSCISIIVVRLNFSSTLKQSLQSFTQNDESVSITTPSLLMSCCRIVLNLMAKEKEETVAAVQSQGLANELFRQVSQWQTSKIICSQERVNMYSLVLEVLVHFTHIPSSCVKDSIPTLIWLLQKSTYCDDIDSFELIKVCLKILGSMASYQKNIDIIFTKEAVDTICSAITSDDASTASAVAHLIFHLSSEANIEIVKKINKIGKSQRVLLASILGSSHASTRVALENGLMEPIIDRLRETQVNLATMPPDILRSRKANIVLDDLSIDLGLLINFLACSLEAKELCVKFGLADIIHKLWAWCLLDVTLLSSLIQVLITFTANCPSAAATLVLTSPMAGVGQRKTPTSNSILHAAISLFSGDVYSVELKKMVLELLCHACQAPEARNVMNKSNLFNEFMKIGKSRRTSQLEDFEVAWLRLFLVYSSFFDCQNSLLKNDDMIEVFFEFVSFGKSELKKLSLAIVRNLVLNPNNKQRFIASDKLLKTVAERSIDHSLSESELCDLLLISWFLAANTQRGKHAIRSVNLDSRLQLAVSSFPDTSPVAVLSKKVFPVIKSP